MYKKILICSIIFLLLMQHASANTLETDITAQDSQRFTSNLFTQMEEESGEVESKNPSLENFEKVSENDYLELYVERETLAIKVRNKETGYIWSSTLDQMEDHQLNQTWQQFVESALTIEYLTRQGSTATESITTNSSEVEISKTDNGFVADVNFTQAQIKMQLSVELEENDIVITIPEDGIEEGEGTQLVSVNVYPFFGATKEDEIPGYMFIPDGSGALIRFDRDSVNMESPYVATIFGDDEGISSTTHSDDINPSFVASMPIFGVVHGVQQNAMLGIIESGETYAQITAYKAGLQTEFNWITARFIYRHQYRQPTSLSEDGGSSIDKFQDTKNSFDATLRFRVLENEMADYVGMARTYQAYLRDLGVLQANYAENPMLRLEFLGGERKPGLLWDSVVEMTPITDIPYFVNRLAENSVEDMLITYRGWSSGGLSGSFPNRFPFESSLGSKSDVNDVVEEMASRGIPMYFHTDYTRAYASAISIFGGTEVANQINSRSISNTREGLLYHYLLPSQAIEMAREDVEDFVAYGMRNLAIDTSSSTLFSVFNRGAEATRGENIEAFSELVSVLNEGGIEGTALYQPNVYAWEMADKYFDIPMTSSQYLFVTDTVPFLQIVLRGYIDYYAPFANFSSNQTGDLLRLIEFGAYPSFILTGEPSHLLAETASRNLYTSEFDTWEDEIIRQYHAVRKALEQVRSEAIIGREVLHPGVVEVVYSNDIRIIVNYTDNPFTKGDLTIEATDFAIVKGE